MERSKAPRRIIDPGPAPGSDVSPVAVAIGGPANNRRMRKPNGAVVGNGAPATVLVQIFVADDIVGDVAAGNGVIFVEIALIAPAIEIIRIGKTLDVRIKSVRTGKEALLARVDGVSGAAAGDLALPIANANDGGVAGFVDIDAVAAGTKNREGQIGRVDFNVFGVPQAPHADVDGALSNANLNGLVIQIEEGEAGCPGKAEGSGIDVQLGASVVVGPELVTGGDGAIRDGGNPVIGAGRTEGDLTVGNAKTRDAARRIVIVGRRTRRNS